MGDEAKKCPCFKCDSFKLDCHGARNCKFTNKVGRSAINTQEIIDQKIKDLKEASKSTRSNGIDSKFEHIGKAKIIQDPYKADEIAYVSKFEYVLLYKSSHDVNLDWSWSFTHQGAINPIFLVDSHRKEISFDFSKNEHHVYNQHSTSDDLGNAVRQKKMWKTLLEIQSTCDFIIIP